MQLYLCDEIQSGTVERRILSIGKLSALSNSIRAKSRKYTALAPRQIPAKKEKRIHYPGQK